MALLDLIRPTPPGGADHEETKNPPDAGVWWPDPALRLLPAAADDFDLGVRAAFAPILHLPPPGCLGPVVCSRRGHCERHAAGRPCLTATAEGEDAS